MRKRPFHPRGKLVLTSMLCFMVLSGFAQTESGLEVRHMTAGTQPGHQIYALDLWAKNASDRPLDLTAWSSDFQEQLGDAFVQVIGNPVVRNYDGTTPPRVDQRFDGTSVHPFFLRDSTFRLPIGKTLRLRVSVEIAPYRSPEPIGSLVSAQVCPSVTSRARLVELYPLIEQPARGYRHGQIAPSEYCTAGEWRTEVQQVFADGSSTLRHIYEDVCGSRLVQTTYAPSPLRQRMELAQQQSECPVFPGLMPWGVFPSAVMCWMPTEAVGLVR